MDPGISPPEPSPNEVVLSRSQRTWRDRNRPDIFVIYNQRTHGFKVKNATIEETTLKIKSQNGKTYRAVLDKYGGRY